MKRASTILAAFATAIQRAQTAQSPNATAGACEVAFRQGYGVLQDAAAWGWRWDGHRAQLLALCESGRYDEFLAESLRQFRAFLAQAQRREFEWTRSGHNVTTIQTLGEVEDTLFDARSTSTGRQRCASLLLSRLVTAEVGELVFHEDPFHGPEHFCRVS